jgi:hypothetical protein
VVLKHNIQCTPRVFALAVLPRIAYQLANLLALSAWLVGWSPMIGENRQLVTDEPVEFEN